MKKHYTITVNDFDNKTIKNGVVYHSTDDLSEATKYFMTEIHRERQKTSMNDKILICLNEVNDKVDEYVSKVLFSKEV